jgi:WbqC-like protein family
MNTVAAHQPNYLPWLGFFAKAACSDTLVLQDTVQFEKNGYTNRVRIKGSQGTHWLTQPVRISGRAFQAIGEVEFADARWPRKHASYLQANYARAPYFSRYFPELAELLRESDQWLAPCNARLIDWALTALGLRTRLVRASDLAISSTTDPTSRLIELVRAVGGSTYVCGQGGANYQNLEQFGAAGIAVKRSPSRFPEYPQLWGEFCEGLSIVDLIFNCGPTSQSYLEGECLLLEAAHGR